MIERQSGFVIFHCDTCPEVLDTDTEDFDPAWAEAKEVGWRAYKEAGEWCHACPACAEDWAKAD